MLLPRASSCIPDRTVCLAYKEQLIQHPESQIQATMDLQWWHPVCWGGYGRCLLLEPLSPQLLCHPMEIKNIVQKMREGKEMAYGALNKAACTLRKDCARDSNTRGIWETRGIVFSWPGDMAPLTIIPFWTIKPRQLEREMHPSQWSGTLKALSSPTLHHPQTLVQNYYPHI